MNEQWHQRQQPRRLTPAGPPPRPSGSGQAPQPAVLVHELVAAAGADGDEARRCARRLAAALPPGARSVLLTALAEADPWHDGEEPHGYEAGGGLFLDGPEYALPAPARPGLSLLPAYRAPAPDTTPDAPGPREEPAGTDGTDWTGETGDREPGDGPDHGPGDNRPGDGPDHGPGGSGPGGGTGDGVWPEVFSGPPAAVIRLRFADPVALERAGACFAGAYGDPETGTLQVPADAGVETLRAVLAALDAAALAPESLTVHTNELDDVLAAFTGLG
ncbi:hypothetical protein ACFV06_01250 [Streptomyces sp. NPDC059618]|uniref:hypothetical protein n=1 Tax=Streptomyces sp. NPDC059618 TaxID=3346887 RepID=UPI0036B33E8C